ncbi:MAG: AzlD domain-containing protein, partial [Clostridia bacterium]
PYGILVAMVFPAVIFSTGSIISACVGGVVALLLSYKKLGLFPVALCATIAVFVTELIVKACC